MATAQRLSMLLPSMSTCAYISHGKTKTQNNHSDVVSIRQTFTKWENYI